jgi:hypothetical protein
VVSVGFAQALLDQGPEVLEQGATDPEPLVAFGRRVDDLQDAGSLVIATAPDSGS